MGLKKLSQNDIYYYGLILMAISLPVSVFGMSVSQFIIGINWLIEGKFRQKFRLVKENRELKVFMLLYLVHLLGLLYTSWPDGFTGPQHNALDELRVKLPLLVFPVIVATSAKLSYEKIRSLLLFFSATVLVSSWLSMLALWGVIPREVNDARDLSLFISHIRFSLMINLAIFSLGYFFIRHFRETKLWQKVLLAAAIIWLSIFLVILKSLTGIVIFSIVCLVILFLFFWKKEHPAYKLSSGLFFLGIIVLLLLTAQKLLNPFIHKDRIDFDSLPQLTTNGNRYYHFTDNPLVENGHWVGLYVCPVELKREWNKRSTIAYDSLDRKGQRIRYTLWRYLTSLNLPKDSSGVARLTPQDVKVIEDGYSNYLFRNTLSIYPRLYQTIWEVDLYLRTGNPTGQSVSQRIEYLKAARGIIEDNPLIGVGTGDAQQAFDRQYVKMKTQLAEGNRHRAHNQFVTFLLQFGVVGFLLILLAVFYPIVRLPLAQSFLFVLFFVIFLVSMLNEDTLETQPGVTFFIFFYALFLFGSKSGLSVENELPVRK